MPEKLRAYTNAADHRALHIGAVFALIVVAAILAILPRLVDTHGARERKRAAEVAAENQRVCEKWGAQEGSRSFSDCVLDLNKLRANQELRLLEDSRGIL